MERDERTKEKQWVEEAGRNQGTIGQQGKWRISIRFNSERVERKKLKNL